MFGQASRPFGFGASTTPTFGATAFGATPTPAFGAAATPAFGAATPTPAFGATATPAFGTSTPAFGSTTPSAFGGGSAAPTFGGGTTAFGASSMTPFGGGGASTFGASTAPAFGSTAPAPSAFGAAAPAPTAFGGFGATTQPTSTFGATTQPSAFGAPSTTTGFGGTTTSSFAFGAGFGSTAPTPSPFGATAAPAAFSSPFGTPATTTTTTPSTTTTGSMFGGATTGFGTFGQPAAAGATTTGTGNPKFQVTTESDANGTVNHQSITAMAAYNKKSFEELRFEDYQAGKKNNTSPALSTAASTSPFGAPAATTTTFGAAPTTSTAFSFPTATTTPASPFGTPSTTATTTPSFGFTSPATTTPATTSPFGTTTSTFPTFGAPTLSTAPTAPTTTASPFGFAPTTSTANPFGTTTPSTSTSPFGATTTPSFTAPSFAAPTTTATTPAFGTTTTTSTANPFGAPASTTSLFAPATANPFSTTTTPSFAAPSLSTTSSLFSPAPTTLPSTSLFSAPSTSAAPTTLFSGFSAPSLQIGLGTQPTLPTPTTSITSPPVAAPLPTFAVPSTPTPIIQASPVAAIPPLSFTPRTPTPQKNSYVSSLPRGLPARSGSLVRVKDSPSYGGGRLFTEDKGFSPSGVHITPENLSLRTATPSKPRVDIKKLNLPPFDERQLSATKPALDISSSDIHSSQLVTPTRPQPFSIQTTPARVRTEVNDLPTLRNPNYYTKPTMDIIREMGSAELSRVEDFTLGCAELGFVRWHGKTDIRGLNLDDIVVFEKKAVTVYPEQGIYPKPPLGDGLNKPATITLLNVVPKKQDSAEKYTQMIANATKKFDGKLLRYDPEKGIWEFEVRHFSRYGLSDDDEEPDVNDATSATASVVAPIEQDTKVLAPKALIAPDLSAPFSQPPPFSSQPTPLPAQSPSALQMSVYAPPEPKARSARLTGLSTRGLLFTEEPAPQQQLEPVQKRNIFPEPPFPPSFLAKERERTERIKSNVPTKLNRQVQNPAPIFTSLPQADQDSSFVVAPLLRLKQLALAESVVSKAPQSQSDISLTMGRSFRVGWAPNGRLVRMSANLGTVTLSRPALSTVSIASPDTASITADANTTGQLERIDRHILDLLQTHLSHSTAQYGPHFTLKDLHANIQANIRICDPNTDVSGSSEKASLRQHLYLVWTLVYSLWGKMPDGAFPQEIAKQLPPDLDADNDEAARLISSHLTRKLLVSKWLTHALQGPVEDAVKSVKLSSGNNALAILHYLTGRQISPAVALAQRSRDYRLAVLLTQTWTSALQLLGIQIEQWEVSNALPFIDKQLLVVYKLLAGDVEHVGKNVQDIRDDWLRSFALHFWYKHVPSTSMPEVLDTYDLAVEKGSASAAIPAYVKNKESANNSTAKDSLYRLLQLYSSTTHHQATPGGPASQAGPTITTTRFAPSTSSLPTTLLLSAINPANQTPDPMDFSLAWHLYTTLRIIPALSSLVDLPVPHRLHTSYAAQLEISGYWQWAIYVLLHINFDSHKTVNGEWGFASGRQEAISSILERHAPNISEGHYQFLTQELQIPASWVDTAIGRHLVYDRKYQAGVQRLLRAGEWNEAHRTILSHLAPFVVAPSSTENENVVTEDTLISLLEGLQPNYTHLADPTWNMGGNIYLAYLRLKQRLGPMPASEDDKSHSQTLQNEIPNIYALCELVAQWNQAHTAQDNVQQTRSRISMVCIATYLGRALQALAQTHRDANLPHRLQALPLPPDVRAVIMEDYFHTMIYAV